MKKLLLLSLALATGCASQSGTKQCVESPTAQTQASQKTKAQLARELAEITISEATHQAIFSQMGQSVAMMLKQGKKNFGDKEMALLMEIMQEILPLEDTRQMQADVAVTYYTQEELVAIVAFHKSPAGKKMLQVLPQVMADSMKLTQARVQERLPAALKKRGLVD